MTALDDPSAPPRFGTAGWILVAAAFAIGFCNFPLQVVGRGFDHVPGDLIDNRLNQGILEHGYLYLTGKVDRFWDIGMFYPVPGVTAWSDAHIGMLPIYSALRASGLPPERAFQGWFLIPFALNFGAAVWACRRLGLGPVGAAAAAFVFAFGMPLAGQGGHSQLVPRFLVPPALVFAWEWLRAPRGTWRAAAAAACAVYQTYISVYIGYFLCLVLAAGFVCTLVLARGRLRWRDAVWPGWGTWVGRGAVVVAATVALVPLVRAHVRNGSEVSREHVHVLAARPLAWITPPGMSANYPDLAQYTKMGSTMLGAGEEQLFPGLLPLLALAAGVPLALAVVVRRRGFGDLASAAAVGACASILLVVLVTKFGPKGETWYYESLLRLPGAGGIRATSRVVLVLLFPTGLVLGALLDAAARRARRRATGAGAAVALLAVGAVVADQWLISANGNRKNDWWWARTPVKDCADRRGRMAAATRADPSPKLVYVFPSVADQLGAGGPTALQLDVLLAIQGSGLPTVNGLSARTPNNWSGNPPPDWGPPVGYRALMKWLTETHHVPPDVLAGLVIIGEPAPDPDPAFDRAMRAAYPPRPVPAAP